MAKYASIGQIQTALTATLESLRDWIAREVFTRTDDAERVAKEARDSANTSRQAAITAQNSAAAKATEAAGSAEGAATAAQNAETAQAAAENSEENAGASESAAEAAQSAAETARGAAEAARDEAETAKTGAETAKDGAEAEKIEAESARDEAVNAKTGAESARAGAETAETNAATAKTAAETAGNEAVTAKNAAETAKAGAEAAQVAAEAAEENAEESANASVASASAALASEQAAAETLESAAKKSEAAPALHGKLTGSASRADDVSPLVHNLAVAQYGQCVQDGTPSPATPVPISGKAAGGSVYAGKSLVDVFPESCTVTNTIRNGSWADSGSKTGMLTDAEAINALIRADTITYSAYIDNSAGNGASRVNLFVHDAATQTYVASPFGTAIAVGQKGVSSVSISFAANSIAEGSVDRLLFGFRLDAADGHTATASQGMVELGSTATAYEPYTAPVAQTVKDSNNQDVTLYGIPVSSGGNVTIGGQQYIADTVEGTTVTRRVGCVDLGTVDWLYYAVAPYVFFNGISLVNGKKAATYGSSANIICDIFTKTSANDVEYAHGSDNIIAIHSGTPRVEIYCASYTDATAFKAAVSGAMLYYELEAPTTETVTLSPATLEVNTPTTTWLSEAYSEVTYNRDINKAWEELSAAIIALGGTI